MDEKTNFTRNEIASMISVAVSFANSRTFPGISKQHIAWCYLMGELRAALGEHGNEEDFPVHCEVVGQ